MEFVSQVEKSSVSISRPDSFRRPSDLCVLDKPKSFDPFDFSNGGSSLPDPPLRSALENWLHLYRSDQVEKELGASNGAQCLNSEATSVTTMAAAPTSGRHLFVSGATAKVGKKRSRASRRAPTTLLRTDTSNFRAMVQQFTGIPHSPFSATPFPNSPAHLPQQYYSSFLSHGNMNATPFFVSRAPESQTRQPTAALEDLMFMRSPAL